MKNLASRFFEMLVGSRNYLFDLGLFPVYHCNIPVISIGNISVGGNGKTPLCLYLAQELISRGYSPVILMRGYKGKISGPYEVKDSDKLKHVGDEALLIKRRNLCPVVIARKKTKGAKYIEQNKLGNIIILDDGLQHRWLARDLNIVTQDISHKKSQNLFISGELLPKGNLREPRDYALSRTQILILAERSRLDGRGTLGGVSSEIITLIPKNIEVFRSFLEVTGLYSLSGQKIEQIPKTASIFCGIANPQGFVKTVESLGIKIFEQKYFSDHYSFRKAEIESYCCQSEVYICTEKDAVKLLELNLSPETQGKILVLRVSAEVIPKDAFIVKVLKYCQK